MKHYFAAVLFLIFSSYSFGQQPSQSPAPTPEQTRIKDFGSSLKRLGKKEKRNSKTQRKNNEPSDDEVIKVKTELAVSDALVTDQKANVITGLNKEDFIVTEDGAPQTIEMFSPGQNAAIPRSIVLILDCGVPQGPYLKNSIAAAKILVDKLDPNDKMAIVTVDLKLRLDFTSDKPLLKKTLDSSYVISDWNIEFDTLLAVLIEMFDEKDRRRIIVFQTDGSEIIWLKPDKDAPYPVSYSTLYDSGMRYTGAKAVRKFGFSEVKEAIERSGATIYSIIPGIRFLGFSKEEQLARARKRIEDVEKFYGRNKEENLPAIIKYYQYARAEANVAGQTALFKVAELSGGNAGFMEKPEDAENAYSDIFTIIKNRYVIGYYPTNQNRDGKLRQVKIEVRNHPEYTVTGRKAYFAPE